MSSNNTAHVLLLCGLPGSGKSSLARSLKESNVDTFDRILHIEYDSITREQLQTQQQTENDNEDVFTKDSLEAWRASRNIALEQLSQQLETHLESNDTSTPSLLIIMDDNFHLRSMRKNVHQLCASHASNNENQVYLLIVWLNTPLSTCLERNEQRQGNNRVPSEVISSMAFEAPDPNKASWEEGWIHCHNAKDISLHTILNHSQVVKPPPPPVDLEALERERQRTRESILHTYDGCLRSWVAVVARIRRQDAGKANAARKNILQSLRKDDINMDSAARVVNCFVEQACSSSEWTDEEITQLKTAMQTNLPVEHL